jgi:O-antigen/teichoic acid export membrane protein
MIQKRQILTNVGMSILQVIFSGIILFVLYRFLVVTIGIEQLGIWSIVLATTMATQISNLGFSGSVVKFVAKYIARAEFEQVSDVIQTAALSICGFIGLILIIAYPLFQNLLGYIMPAHRLADALSLLPYALFSFWLTTIASIFQASLDGCQRIDLRSLLLMGSSLLYLLLAWLMVPNYKLLGLAYAQILQAGSLLLLSWLLLRRILNFLPIIPYCWNRDLFMEMLFYGTNFQLTSIMAMLFDPITKVLLSKFGNLTMVGYYEMAYRMIIQFRAIIVKANQVLVPVIANLNENTPEYIKKIYKHSYRLLIYLALPFFGGILTAIPLISVLWTGHYEMTFISFALLLTVANFCNILASPAYFANLGTGKLFWNTLAHVVIAVLNVGLGLLMGVFYGGHGVVIASVLALIIGSGIIIIAYHAEYHIPISELLPQENHPIALLSVTGVILSLFIYYYFHELNSSSTGIFCLLFFTGILFFQIWSHPMRAQLMLWLTTNRLKITK